VGRHVYEHIVVENDVSCEQVPAAGRVVVEIKNHLWPPLADELMDGCRLGAEQELMVPVQVNPVCIAAGTADATIRVCLRDNGQLKRRQPLGYLIRGDIKEGLERATRSPLVAMLAGQNQNL